MHIEDLLREPTIQAALGEHYRAGVRAAVETYPQHAADEDSVTGALGQALAGRGLVELPTGEEVFWVTSYTRFRSGGPNSAERRLGGDGVFEIQLSDPDGVPSRKSLVFQAKNRASGFGDARLRRQARQIAALPGGGIVINYDEHAFTVLDAREVSARAGARLRDGMSLESALADEFVPCKRGSTAYYYDPLREAVFIAGPGGHVQARALPLSHRLRTTLAFFAEQMPPL
jgi:hypothetical protein